MPITPQQARIGLPAVSLLVLGIVMPALPLGCESLGPEHKTEPVPTVHTSIENREVVARGAAPATPPGKFATRRGYYVFYHDFDLDPNDRIFADLETLPDQVCSELRLPASNTVVQVFLFDTQERYDRFMRIQYPHLPSRRAYFLQEPAGCSKDLKIYTWMGEHMPTDLRHELTHALLHGVLKDVPIWLDEGLAGYFELPPANEGVNVQHLDIVRRGSFDPSLSRLEKLSEVKQMEKPQYREAWAWVHFMLRSDPAAKTVLQEYLQALRSDPNPGPLLPRLREAVPDLDQRLAEHFNAIDWPLNR